MNQKTEMNPFEKEAKQPASLVEVEQSRAIQEVQAAMIIAKKFPRDAAAAMDKILDACTRTTLADQAVYAYPRGGQVVTGPSIRLAEALAQSWGNIQFGIRELEQVEGSSTVEAYAWELETNTRQSKIFQVAHVRSTRQGNKALTDPRDIYEITANQGARRLRNCILGVIPGDVIDAAVNQCSLTQQNLNGAPKEQLDKLVKAFKKYKVTVEMLEKRLGHNLAATIGAEVVTLKQIYASIRDNMAKPEDFFGADIGKPEVETPVSASDGAAE